MATRKAHWRRIKVKGTTLTRDVRVKMTFAKPPKKGLARKKRS